AGRVDLERVDLVRALSAMVPAELAADLERLAPEAVTVPSGRRVPLDYGAGGGAGGPPGPGGSGGGGVGLGRRSWRFGCRRCSAPDGRRRLPAGGWPWCCTCCRPRGGRCR